MDAIEKIAATVLYEGYLLWPYRRSARKNQQRWTFGGVYPQAHSAQHPDDPWQMQTECLVSGAAPQVTVKVRFLHIVARQVVRQAADKESVFVDELTVAGERYLAWDEAVEREILIEDVVLATLQQPKQVPIQFAAGSQTEPLLDPDGVKVGALVRSWHALAGTVEIQAQVVQEKLFRLTVWIANTTPWQDQARAETLRQTFVSTHTMLQVNNGTFISLLETPESCQTAAAACQNLHTWPVLAGEVGDAHIMLSSPIILYDYPQVAPESQGDLFDGGEIDQLLLLNVLTLTNEEKAEMRATDPRARAILERSESLTRNDFMQLHGAIRECRTLGEEAAWPPIFTDLAQPAPPSVLVAGVEISAGSRVRLHPRPGGDIMDLALAGKVACVESIEQDDAGKFHLAVTLDDDPGRDLGQARLPGHRFFFALNEVEPLGKQV